MARNTITMDCFFCSRTLRAIEDTVTRPGKEYSGDYEARRIIPVEHAASAVSFEPSYTSELEALLKTAEAAFELDVAALRTTIKALPSVSLRVIDKQFRESLARQVYLFTAFKSWRESEEFYSGHGEVEFVAGWPIAHEQCVPQSITLAKLIENPQITKMFREKWARLDKPYQDILSQILQKEIRIIATLVEPVRFLT